MDAQSERLPFEIRKAKTEDSPFIFDSWRKFHRARVSPRMSSQNYNYMMTCRTRMLWKRAGIWVAHHTGHPDDLIGWVCAEMPVLHYLFVKKFYQGQGVARALLEKVGIAPYGRIYCTHWVGDDNKTTMGDHTFINCEV